jgi:uncharacterized membrane protein
MPNSLEHKIREIGGTFSRNRVGLSLFSALIFLFVWVLLAFGLSDETAERLHGALPSALNTIAGIGVSVLITTFSFVFVALSLVSVQFSPRVVRHFWHGDLFRRTFLWLFIFCFGFCFAVQFLDAPKLQLFGLIWGFYAIFVLFPIFLGYLADNLNAASIINRIAGITAAEIKSSYDLLPKMETARPDVFQIESRNKGFLEHIDAEKLAEVFSGLKEKDPQISMRITNYLGSFIEYSSVLAEISPKIEVDPKTSKSLAKCFRLSKFRSIDQDVEYGIRQLVDIAIKAISPAVNDPTTCVNCLHYLGVILKSLAVRDDRSVTARVLERHGIYLLEPKFEKYLDDAFNQIYQWGKSDYVVVKTIINVLCEIISVVPVEERFRSVLHELDEMEISYLFDAAVPSPITLSTDNFKRASGVCRPGAQELLPDRRPAGRSA